MRFLIAMAWTLPASVLFIGCGGERMPAAGTNWLPQSTGGKIEIRKLPPAAELQADYFQWLRSDPKAKVRLYEVSLSGSTNQTELEVITQKGDTPVGAAVTTFIRFIYNLPTNGAYELVWSLRGRHQMPPFLKATAVPRKILLMPVFPLPEGRMPRLQIVGIENVESHWFLIAERGDQKLPLFEKTNSNR